MWKKINEEDLLKSKSGQLSSKRYGLTKSLTHYIWMSWVGLAVLLYKEQYNYVVDLIWGAAAVCLGFGGVVASERFTRNENSSNK